MMIFTLYSALDVSLDKQLYSQHFTNASTDSYLFAIDFRRNLYESHEIAKIFSLQDFVANDIAIKYVPV